MLNSFLVLEGIAPSETRRLNEAPDLKSIPHLSYANRAEYIDTLKTQATSLESLEGVNDETDTAVRREAAEGGGLLIDRAASAWGI
ncbi:hypothetical protein N7474_003496 [Penicillium riverlandense]|uniref:uncharacterized protein n=1 Tax=Penicillium riverlandense TaxID=1903569 RepID=UPI002548218A|nr:uncharacterized protein N7474_003496 [Penicillium riverlandense]KAJ5826358.1 hypothetical protein N7474_003496 [Penicillium riverlandense]